MTLPKTELWFIDIKKIIYDTLKNYTLLIEKLWTTDWRVIIRNVQDVSNTQTPFITFQQVWSRTNAIWIRTAVFQFDVWSKNLQEGEEIKDIVVNLFNRANIWGIKSILQRESENSEDKTKLNRHSLDFQFTFKDMKY
jgi:hypothetical protein